MQKNHRCIFKFIVIVFVSIKTSLSSDLTRDWCDETKMRPYFKAIQLIKGVFEECIADEIKKGGLIQNGFQ